eukprot:12880145-Prorocentrum_lima.AAC.1
MLRDFPSWLKQRALKFDENGRPVFLYDLVVPGGSQSIRNTNLFYDLRCALHERRRAANYDMTR